MSDFTICNLRMPFLPGVRRTVPVRPRNSRLERVIRRLDLLSQPRLLAVAIAASMPDHVGCDLAERGWDSSLPQSERLLEHIDRELGEYGNHVAVKQEMRHDGIVRYRN